jgi:hypothetical protein
MTPAAGPLVLTGSTLGLDDVVRYARGVTCRARAW